MLFFRVLVLSLLPLLAVGQLTVQFPTARFVTQRGLDNQGRLYVAARFPSLLGTDQAEAQLTPVAAGQGVATAWQPLQTNVPDGLLLGAVVGMGGWYMLTVRVLRAGIPVGQATVQPVGIGEVFLLAGQSNARGVANNDNDLGAVSDRVSTIDTINHYFPPNFPALFSSGDPMPFAAYVPLTAGKRVFPMGGSSWAWGELGDYLVRRLNVPVLFYNAGWDAATVDNWSNTAKGVPACNLYFCAVNWPNLQPYTNLRNLMGYYGATGGFRAVLWHQGESESIRPSTIPIYAARLDSLIRKTRQDFDNRVIPWVVSRVSFDGQTTSAAVLNQQQTVIQTPGLNVFQGPLTDSIQNRNGGQVDVHFANGQRPAVHPAYFLNPQTIPATMGLSRLARTWNNSLPDSFFQTATPLLPRVFAQTGLVSTFIGGAVSPGDSVLVSFFSSGAFSAANRWEVQVLDAQGRFQASLGQGAASPVRVQWPAALGAGAYRVRVVATSPVAAGAPTPVFAVVPPADVRLNSMAAKRTLALSDLTSVSVVLTNAGPGRATSLAWQCRLPPNLVASAPGTGVGVVSGVVSGTLAGLEPGQQATQVFRVQAVAAGVFRLATEISLSGTTDPDSQPNTGTADGQDDTAMLDLRVGDGTTLYTSPNPNQVPLPVVRGNQPVPVAGKADLSLQLTVSNRTPKINDLVRYTLVVSNVGGAAASNVNTTAYLPAGLVFFDSDTMGPGGGGITGTTLSLASGALATISFRARVTSGGLKKTYAQVRVATPADPDSTPGNGFPASGGEDDEAVVDLRVP